MIFIGTAEWEYFLTAASATRVSRTRRDKNARVAHVNALRKGEWCHVKRKMLAEGAGSGGGEGGAGDER
jgi:hypothetical protein